MKKRGKIKRSQTGLIVTVILIVMVLAGIIIVWNVVFAIINSSSSKVSVNPLANQVEVSSVDLSGYTLEVKVKRDSGKENIDALKFIFYDSSGLSRTLERKNDMPSIFETKSFTFNQSEINMTGKNIIKISVIPVFGKSLGMEKSKTDFNDKRILITNGNAETGNTLGWTVFSGVTSIDSHSGIYCFDSVGSLDIRSDFIEINPEKTYYQEGWFKSNGTGGLSRLYFGYVPYDKDKVEIQNQNVDYFNNSETQLYQAVNAGDTIIKIVNGTNWGILSYATIAFNIDDSGNYNDLPNYNTSGINVISKTPGPGYYNITLGTGVTKSYPAGTKVREHKHGGTYMYSSASNVFPNATIWTNYSSQIRGVSSIGQEAGKWRKGTKYVKTLILANEAQNSNFRTLIDDIRIVTLD